MLLDAPCTALGLRPKLQQSLSLPQLLEAAAYQRQLLAAAVRLVEPGGYLVYSTCSVGPGEGGWISVNCHSGKSLGLSKCGGVFCGACMDSRQGLP